MSRVLRQAFAVGALSAVVAACASTPEPRVNLPSSAGVYKVGKPYQINGSWYYPHEQPDYDETGVASWYGPTFYGRRTADGEVFDANALTAAHRTLPMPVNVRVTNLGNGKSLVLRVNDRGPFAKSRIIDVSERAAQLLGFYRQGTARVRVTYLGRADGPGGGPKRDETPPQIATALPAAPAGEVAVDGLNAVPGAPIAPPVVLAPLPSPAPIAAGGRARAAEARWRRDRSSRSRHDPSLCAGRRLRFLRQCAPHAGAPERRRQPENFVHRQKRRASL